MCSPYLSQDDRRDEETARELRQELGQMRWLVSWTRRDDGSWLARLSGPQMPETVESVGETRCKAIEQAADTSVQILGAVLDRTRSRARVRS